MHMKNLILLIGLLASAAMAAPSGYVTKSAVGSDNAAVYFEPGIRPARLISFDVTSDASTGAVYWAVGGNSATVLFDAADDVTNIIISIGTFASNDVLLAMTAAGDFAELPAIYSATSTTNAVVILHNPLGTNLAIGDTVRELSSTYYSLLKPTAAEANLWFLDGNAGIAADDVLLFEVSPWSFETNVVATAVTNTLASIPLAAKLPFRVVYGAAARERTGGTNFCTLLAAVAADGTTLHVNRTNGFVAGAVIVLEKSTGGGLKFCTINTGGVDTTNITLTAGPGVAFAAGDTAWVLTTTAYTVGCPAEAEDQAIVLSASTGLATGDELIIAGSMYNLSVRVAGTASTFKTYTLTCDEAAGLSMDAGARVYALTETVYSLSKAAAAQNTALTLESAAGIASGDFLLISPDTGGHIVRQVSTTAEDIYNTVELSDETGTSLTAGDRVYVLGAAVSTLVGDATLRLSGPALYILPANVPGKFTVTGESNCSINSLTLDYGP
jgi:hypothetical protein